MRHLYYLALCWIADRCDALRAWCDARINRSIR